MAILTQSMARRAAQCVAIVALLASGSAAAQRVMPPHSMIRVGGVVTDETGAPIPDAKVEVESGAFRATTTTSQQGQFNFELPSPAVSPIANGTITVGAQGFTRLRHPWSSRDADLAHLNLVLTPAGVSETVTVTATRTAMRLSDTAADTVVLTPADLAATAALTLDDALRQVPGFSLLRQSGSRAANPTSQGVSLRGVGASGASRALVLADGIPLNDPFGGWVYWHRVPRESVSGVEVVRGGASDLYGNYAMGGVVNVVTRQPVDTALFFESSYGNEATPDASLSSSLRAGRWAVGFDGEAFHTDGYVLVPDSIRGPVDNQAGSDNRAGSLRLDRIISENARVFAQASIFGEARANGKVDERNDTHVRQLALGGDWQSDALGSFAVRAYGGPEVFNQNFYAVALDRSNETLTRVQRVPVRRLGGSAQWSRPVGTRQTLVAGIDAQEVRGSSDELAYAPLPPVSAVIEPSHLTSAIGVGGRQRTFGLFGEDVVRLTPRWIVTVAARFDHWRNYDALSATRPLARPGPLSVIDFPNRTEQAFSPRLSVLRKVNDHVSLTASGYRAFRAPTLNELYRSFRLGNILTLANSNLTAEHLTGAEAGALVTALDNRLSVRGTFFWSDITRPVANVTLNVTPTLITRERENLGRTRSRGVDLDATIQLAPDFTLSGGYELANARVVSFPANPALVGLFIPLVPRQQATFQLRYSNPSSANRWTRLTWGIQGRAVGADYDDDQNTLRLGRYFSLDALVSRPLTRGFEVFAASENLLNQRYDVGRTPVETLGPPALVRAGIRLELRGR
ncbi:MAG TPA: TonB-dependent receptor [Terriglobia bacterium]|nr:TonB-dependent receptor [Terriglobia bacterium]